VHVCVRAMYVCVCACAHVCVCVNLRARACACVYACLCERMCVCLCDSIGLQFRARVCAAALCAPSHRTAAACGIYSSARAARCGRVRGCVRCDRPGSRAFGRRFSAGFRARSAAGVTWTSRTASAGWAARLGHTSVVDAAGAIYVIGGEGSDNYNDVWVSTDGGARAGLGRGGGRGVLEGVLGGYLGGNQGYKGVV
jgi:hypothetical protein